MWHCMFQSCVIPKVRSCASHKSLELDKREEILLGGARFHPASFILYAYLKDAFISSYFALFLVVFGPKV